MEGLIFRILRYTLQFYLIPSVASKHGHKTKKACFAAKHLLKQTVTPKVSCLYVFDQQFPLIFCFSQLSGIFLTQTQHTCLQN